MRWDGVLKRGRGMRVCVWARHGGVIGRRSSIVVVAGAISVVNVVNVVIVVVFAVI